MSCFSVSRSTTLPLASSPHCNPITDVAGTELLSKKRTGHPDCRPRKIRQQSLQKETGHRYTPTSGQETYKLYSSEADSKAGRAVFCETTPTGRNASENPAIQPHRCGSLLKPFRRDPQTVGNGYGWAKQFNKTVGIQE